MSRVRQPAVAGTFYPADPRALASDVGDYLRRASPPAPPAPPKALIVPHAGFVYSGPVAASAYGTLRDRPTPVERVVLLGPSHRVALAGLAATAADAFRTPLGAVPVDRDSVEQALRLRQVRQTEAAHEFEHSLEVQLPFLQHVLDDFCLVPFTVGDADAAEVDELLELLWGDAETLVVVSSDLSHYHDYATAQRLDAATTRAIESCEPDHLGPESACGRAPIRGLLVTARRHGLRCHRLDVRNSGDTAGPRDQVVGYAAYAFC